MTNKSVFDPVRQQDDLPSKVISGLERISEVFKSLLWEKAKKVGLSPIQIQILIFIAYHKSDLCNVSHLAKEFNITKPTVSDAVKMLDQKKLIVKDYSSPDSRSYTMHLSTLGEKMVAETHDFANPLASEITDLGQDELTSLFETLSELIYKLNQSGVLSIQRTCYGCKFYDNNGSHDYCRLLNTRLPSSDIRLDCPEFEEKEVG